MKVLVVLRCHILLIGTKVKSRVNSKLPSILSRGRLDFGGSNQNRVDFSLSLYDLDLIYFWFQPILIPVHRYFPSHVAAALALSS